MVALPKLTKEGYRILSYRLKDYTPNRLIFGEGVKVKLAKLLTTNSVVIVYAAVIKLLMTF